MAFCAARVAPSFARAVVGPQGARIVAARVCFSSLADQAARSHGSVREACGVSGAQPQALRHSIKLLLFLAVLLQ